MSMPLEWGNELLLPAGVFVIDGGVETEIVLDPLAFSSLPAIPTTRQRGFADLATMLPVAHGSGYDRFSPDCGLPIREGRNRR